MKAFLEKIADHILLKYINNLDKTVVVLPTKRSIIFLKKFIAKKIVKPIFLPQFYTIEQYIESLSGLNVIDNISLQFYLYKSYLKVSKKPKSLSDFLSWSSILLRDFNDVDTNLVNPKQLFNNIRNVKELENWKINDWSLSENELSEFQTNYIDFFESMYEIYLDFTDCLRDESFAFQGMANKYAAENISNINLEYDKVLFIGLNALTYSEHKIIDFLRQNDIARVFWDADEYYYNNKNHAASFFLKKQQKNWQEISFKGLGDYLSIKKDLFQIVSCPHNIAQTKVMSQVLSNVHNDELNKTAIILANEELLFPALNLIPENINPNNYLPYAIPGIEILISVVFITIVGGLSLSFFGKKILGLIDDLFKRIPVLRTIYSAIVQMTETFSNKDENDKKSVVLVEYPRKGVWAVGFATKENKGEMAQKTNKKLINVFVPTTPNPTSGFLLMFPLDEVIHLNMTFEEASKFIVSAGTSTGKN